MICIEFSNDQTFKLWEDAIRHKCFNYDSRGYTCIYLDPNRENHMWAAGKAIEMGAKKKY